MDIERQTTIWAKSTQNRIQLFLDNYLIRSPIAAVRNSSQRLIFSLFKKGNQQQRLRILCLIEARCHQLVWMGKSTQQFLLLVKNIFCSIDNYSEHKRNIIKKIYENLQKVHKNIISNPQYEFYSFASNLIDFGNQQFKPYLLEANGCLKCFGCSEPKTEPFKLQSCVQTIKTFSNKLQYIFKRIYEVKQLVINLKTNGRMKSVTVYYLDQNKEYKKLSANKFRPGETISASAITMQGLMFQFDLVYSGTKKRIQCIFCDVAQQLNGVCSSCPRRSDVIDIVGNFKVVGADQNLISDQLCSDYQKIQDNVNAIKNLHSKMQSKQKINLNFKLDQMVQVYQRIINNLGLLHLKNPSKLKAKDDQNCFSCNYYEILNIVKFLKQTMKKFNNVKLQQQETNYFKHTLKNSLENTKIQFLKLSLLQTLAVFIVNAGRVSYQKEFESIKLKFRADLISRTLIALKQKRNNLQTAIDDELSQIRAFLQIKHKQLRIDEKIQIFVSYFLDWQFLSLVLANNFTQSTQINRLTIQQYNQLSRIIDFDLSQVFNLNLNTYLKAFLKILPSNIVPAASLDIADSQFLQYVDNKIPEIQNIKIQQSIIYSPNPMIKLDMFSSLHVLITQLPVKQSVKVMNSLFPYRNVWNLNIIKACKKFDSKLSQLPAQQQIEICLQGYCKSKQYLYIQKIYKLLVPQRLPFIIRLQAPISEIQINNIEYPYLSNRQVKSQDLQGETIKSLHDWVYQQLVKMNQAMPLDIIVQKNIIDNMDLPIQLVHQNISESKSKRKIGDKQYQFFRVIYRIQGVLGEPKQRSIGNLRDQKLQTCISNASYFLNKFSQQFNKKIGLDVLIQMLQQIKPGKQSEDKKILLFQILSTLSMNQAINKKIVQGQYGDSIINATVRLMSFQNEKDAKITNFLLQLSSKVIDQANKQMINLRKGSVGQYRKMSGMDTQQINVTQSEKKVKYVLQKIAQCDSTYDKTGNALYRDISRRLIKLLPFCSKDQNQPSQILFNFFQFANWSSKSSSKMQSLFVFMDSLSQSYMTFKCISGQKGVTNQIIKHIQNAIRKQGKLQIDQKRISVNKSQTQSALLLLCALVQGDQNLQGNIFQSKIFHNIYQISLIPPKKAVQINAGRVPQNCYKIIKYLTEGKIIDSRISSFLNQRKKAEKSSVQPKKNKKWQMMKNKQKQVLSKRMDNQLEQQKDLVICSSCQQGYSKKKQILGLYIYLTKNQIPMQVNWWKDSRRFPSFTSTTYFTAIHLQCHNKAYQADQKINRSQWDGALIRNMDVLCNSWIPFKGPKTTQDQFSRAQRKYFQKNKNGNYWNVINDLSTLIQKLSIQFDFATESKGSNSSHNFRYIPIMIEFGCHMIERAGGCANIQQGLAYLMENPPKKLATINNLACYSIFINNYEWFNKNKTYFYKWILNHKVPEATEQKNFQTLKTNLLYIKIVQQIFELLHKHIKQDNVQVKFYKLLDQHITTHLHDLIPEFQNLNERYKTKYTKFSTFNEFEA